MSILVYHFACPANHRRAVIDEKVDQVLKEVWLGIADRYQPNFLEIGTEKDHVHFLVQSVPGDSPAKIITMIKGLRREKFLPRTHWSKRSWGSEFWTDGYYDRAVGQQATERVINQYVKLF